MLFTLSSIQKKILAISVGSQEQNQRSLALTGVQISNQMPHVHLVLFLNIFLTFYIDYRMYSDSALVSASAAIRSAVAAAFPLFKFQLFTNMSRSCFFFVFYSNILIILGLLIVGYKLGMQGPLIGGCIALLFLPFSFLFYKYGARIRAHSNFAPRK